METNIGENRTVTNPLIGDQVTFLVTNEESKGEYELVEVWLKPGGGNDLHFHTSFEEHFEAVEGTLYVDCNGETFALKPGETITAKRGDMHRFYNPGTEPITFLVKILPARHFESTLRIAYGLARDSRVHSTGIPKNLFEMAVIFHIGETYIPKIPLFVQTTLSSVLYKCAKWTGVEKRLKQKYIPS